MHTMLLNNICKRPYSIARIKRVARFTSTNDRSENSPKKMSMKEKRPMYSPEAIEQTASIDEPPTTCCMSGCANCVYIEWANALSKQMASKDPAIAKKVLENVTDPSMKAYLQMELRNLGLIK